MSEDFLAALWAAWRKQGKQMPEALQKQLRACIEADEGSLPQALALADARGVLAKHGLELVAGSPDWHASSADPAPHSPFGSLWIGEVANADQTERQLWECTADKGWQALWPDKPQDAALPIKAWLLRPVQQSNDNGASFWSMGLNLLQGRIGGIALASFFINLGMLSLPLFSMLMYDKVVHNGIFETLWTHWWRCRC